MTALPRPPVNPMRDPLRAALLRIAAAEKDPAERAAKLEILKKDGWL